MADRAVIRAFLQAVKTRGASPREAKALFESGIVESGLRNLNYGDRDSLGSLQQRPSSGYKHATQPYQAALDFLDRARAANTQGGSAGQLAQRVQRSAFPARYDQHAGEAAGLLAGKVPAGGAQTRTTTSTTSLTPGADQARRSALAQFVLGGANADPLALAQKYAALGQQTQTTTSVKTTGSTGGSSPAPKAAGTVSFDGKPVAAWIAPALSYARQHGWKGTVTSGFRTDAQQKAIYDRGVRPAAVPKAYGGSGSNHEGSRYPLGAVDVSDAQTLARILQDSRYAHLLVYAGAKDPVHFSHPHSGGY